MPKPKIEQWGVAFSFDPADHLVIFNAMPGLISLDRVSMVSGDVVTTGSAESFASLMLTVDARTADEARVDAAGLLEAILNRAGVEQANTTVVGIRSPIFGEERYAQLLSEAQGLALTRQPDLAVVRAQTAAELFATSALTKGLIPQMAGWQRLRNVIAPALNDDRSQAVFEAFTGVAIQRQHIWWATYRAHLARRNAIVHSGLIVSQDDALASIAAVKEFIAFLQRQWSGDPHPS